VAAGPLPPPEREAYPLVFSERAVSTLQAQFDALEQLGEAHGLPNMVAAARRWRGDLTEAPTGPQAQMGEFQFQAARFGHAIIGTLNQFDATTEHRTLDYASKDAIALVVGALRKGPITYEPVGAYLVHNRFLEPSAYALRVRDMLLMHRESPSADIADILMDIRRTFAQEATNGVSYLIRGLEDAKQMTLARVGEFTKNNPLVTDGAHLVLDLALPQIHAATLQAPVRIALPGAFDHVQTVAAEIAPALMVARVGAAPLAASVAPAAVASLAAPALGA
jgi:hypothetical protein